MPSHASTHARTHTHTHTHTHIHACNTRTRSGVQARIMSEPTRLESSSRCNASLSAVTVPAPRFRQAAQNSMHTQTVTKRPPAPWGARGLDAVGRLSKPAVPEARLACSCDAHNHTACITLSLKLGCTDTREPLKATGMQRNGEDYR